MTEPTDSKAPRKASSSVVGPMLAHAACCLLLPLLLVSGVWVHVALPRWPWVAAGVIAMVVTLIAGGVWFFRRQKSAGASAEDSCCDVARPIKPDDSMQ